MEFKNKNDSCFEELDFYCFSDTVTFKRTEDHYKTPFELFSEDRDKEACDLIKENGSLYMNEVNNLEALLNALGYQKMRSVQLESALCIFKLNTDLFPESYNVYDSYGEALLKNGEEQKAIENYRRSVEINPQNENGKRVLKELGVDI
jgi:tetratricopeptide (TPR) repeat protein